MKFLLMCCVCLALSSADVQKILQSNSTAINHSDADGAEKNTFRVFSLNSYDHQNPLIIRSNIPEELKPSEGDIKNVDNSSPKNVDLPAPRLGELELPLPYSHKVFLPPAPSYSFEGGSSNLEVVPTLKIDSLSELSPLLISERPFAVGVSFVSSAIPQYPPINAYSEVSPEPSYPVLPPLPYSHVVEPLPKVHSHANAKSYSYFDYVIKKVPEVTSFSKPGIFTEADIPTIAQFEAIFNKSVSSDFQPIVVEARFKGGESSVAVSNATSGDEAENNTPPPGTPTTGSASSESIWDFVNSGSPQTSTVKSEDLTTVVAETDNEDLTLVSQNDLDAVFVEDKNPKLGPVDREPLTLADATTVTEEPEASTLAL